MKWSVQSRKAAAIWLAAAMALPAALYAQSRIPGQRPPVSTDEGGIWELSDKAELEAKRAGQLITHPALNAYVERIKCKVAPEFCKDMRVYLMARPAFNASMAPNGYMEVWSGLLLRAENEAQVAFVIAHETGHFEESHSIEAWRTVRSRSNWALGLSVVAGVAGAPSYVGDIIYLGTIASIFGYSRENESEADQIGFNRSVKASYDPDQGGALWRQLISEANASQFPDVRRRSARSSIFNTHPVSTERARSLEVNAAATKAGNEVDAGVKKEWIVGQEAHRAAIRPFLSTWLRDELRRRDYGQFFHLITQLKRPGTDLGVLTYFEAEGYRLRRGDGDLNKAFDLYVQASQQADAPADVWRELGDAHARAGRKAEAKAALETYLVKAPAASDRALVEARMNRLANPT